MPQITRISPQKNKKRVNVYLDGKYSFALDLETFVKSGIKVEGEITDEQITKLTLDSDYRTTLERLYIYASLRPRSEKEIHDWFRRKDVHQSLQPKLIGKLKKYELYDDKKFAVWWLGQRLSFKSKSKRELEQELRMKGISREIINEVLSDFEISDVGSAKQLLAKNAYKWSKLGEKDAKRKKTEYLARKGFGWSDIKKAIDD